MPFRRNLRVIGTAFACLVALDTAVWWWLSGRVVALYTAWQTSQIADGYTITTGLVSRAGWPFWPAAVMPNVVMAMAGRPAGFTWRTASLRLTYVPWHPGVFTAEPVGPQSLQAGGAVAIPIAASRLAATVPLGLAQPGGVMVEGRSIAILLPLGMLKAERLSLHWQRDDVDMAITLLALPARFAEGTLPFSGVVNALSLHAHATIPLLETGGLAATLVAWRRAGGELQLSDITLHWGPLEARGTATLTLDAAMQPQGTGTVRMTGYQEMVDAMLRTGAITRSDASIASAMLGLLSTGEPAKRGVTLPLRLQDGVLSVGAVPLLRLPKLMPP